MIPRPDEDEQFEGEVAANGWNELRDSKGPPFFRVGRTMQLGQARSRNGFPSDIGSGWQQQSIQQLTNFGVFGK
jgi:hypothetical protein